MRLADKILVHQVHQVQPVKIGADVPVSLISNMLLWKGRPKAASALCVLLPVTGSLAVLGLADLDALAAIRRGRYVLAHMPPAAQVLQLADDALMGAGTIRRRAGLIAAGAAVVAVGWSYGAWSWPTAAEDSHPDRGVQEAGLVD